MPDLEFGRLIIEVRTDDVIHTSCSRSQCGPRTGTDHVCAAKRGTEKRAAKCAFVWFIRPLQPLHVLQHISDARATPASYLHEKCWQHYNPAQVWPYASRNKYH